jgi:hypothetical protein
VFFLAGARVAGQSLPSDRSEYTYRATRVATPPVIDGDLSDPVWQDAAILTQFVQIVPRHGAPPSERTEARVVYDDDALYAAFYAHESNPAATTRTMMRYRWDQIWQLDDVIRFAIDTFHDHRRGYAFSFNAYGTKQDAQRTTAGFSRTGTRCGTCEQRRLTADGPRKFASRSASFVFRKGRASRSGGFRSSG